jgi:hypothetical protein
MDQKLAAHDQSIEAHRKGIVSLYTAIENLMPILSDRQIGFKGKGAGKATDKPKGTTPVRP